MIFISHRGNLLGPNHELENDPIYITSAMKQGFHVEIDVWKIDNQLYLGHDSPQYQIEKEFLSFSPRLWCHAKNLPALAFMLNNNIHCFWHQTDNVTLTSQNYLWTYPGKEIALERAIAVMPESIFQSWDISSAFGVCSDYVEKLRENYL